MVWLVWVIFGFGWFSLVGLFGLVYIAQFGVVWYGLGWFGVSLVWSRDDTPAITVHPANPINLINLPGILRYAAAGMYIPHLSTTYKKLKFLI